MKLLFLIIGGLICLVILIYIIGLLLPKERVVVSQSLFFVSPEILYKIVTNNNDWQYRNSLKDLIILENNDGFETWNEISKNGTVIRFQTKEKQPFSFYSFDMETEMFVGYWTGEFKSNGVGKTIFTATEYIRIRSPFLKTLSYIFFDIGKLMDEYQNDLKQKIKEYNS